MATNVVMPQLGESVVEGTVGKWLKQVGDSINQYEPVMEVITDKVTTEIPSPAAGTLLQVLVPEGTTVKAGTVLAVIGQPGEKGEAAGAPPAPEQAQPSPAPSTPAPPPLRTGPDAGTAAAKEPLAPLESTPAIAAKKDGGAATRLTPVVARMISEFHITNDELQAIQGTGEGGRVSKKDIENFLKTRKQPQAAAPELAPWEQPGTGELFRPTEEIFGKPAAAAAPKPAREGASAPAPQTAPAAPPPLPEQVVPLTQMRRAIAEHMTRQKQTVPHVTTIHEADMTRVMEHLKAHQEEFARQGVKLTYTAYLVQAAVAALRAVPLVNAQYTDQGVVMRSALNIGVAVAIEEGLIVPVVKNAADKSLLGLARAVNDLSTRARENRLTPDDVQGATFTITNYGVFGSLFGTPVIPQSTSAILGAGAIQKRVVVINDAIAIRPMVYLGLTFDHRLLDGATGDRFMNALKEFLGQFQKE